MASTSPRRRELLERAGVSFVTASPDVDETPRRGEKPTALVRRLARAKALAALAGQAPEPGRVVLAADTIVVDPSGKRVLGKPVDEPDARRMLKLIAGRTHRVYTGYCLIGSDRARPGKSLTVVRVVCTRVTMSPMDADGITRYLLAGESMDKAGSYAAQGVGMTLIQSISGSYTNVVGLPVHEVLKDLRRW
ncbi:MAG: septum formation protein Maf [Bdellovibrionales bacterium]|nr:septum formation protein Maf [Bdellovibrionales bacterium]